MADDSGTPIFDDVVNWLDGLRRIAPFRHGDGLCHGCQFCLSDAYDMDSEPNELPEDLMRNHEHGNTAVH